MAATAGGCNSAPAAAGACAAGQNAGSAGHVSAPSCCSHAQPPGLALHPMHAAPGRPSLTLPALPVDPHSAAGV
jgi:hypothetical protein